MTGSEVACDREKRRKGKVENRNDVYEGKCPSKSENGSSCPSWTGHTFQSKARL